MLGNRRNNLNEAHKESLELLGIIHNICINNRIKYTISADSLVAFEGGMDFDDCIPVVYISLLFKEFSILKKEIMEFCGDNQEYS